MNTDNFDNQDPPIEEIDSDSEMVQDLAEKPFVFSQRDTERERQKKRQAVGLLETTPLEELREPTMVGEHQSSFAKQKREKARRKSKIILDGSEAAHPKMNYRQRWMLQGPLVERREQVVRIHQELMNRTDRDFRSYSSSTQMVTKFDRNVLAKLLQLSDSFCVMRSIREWLISVEELYEFYDMNIRLWQSEKESNATPPQFVTSAVGELTLVMTYLEEIVVDMITDHMILYGESSQFLTSKKRFEHMFEFDQRKAEIERFMGIDRVAIMQKEASEAAAAEEAKKKREDEDRLRELFTFEAQLHDSTQPFAVTIDSCDALQFYYDKMVQHKRVADADSSKISKRPREDQEAELMFSSR